EGAGRQARARGPDRRHLLDFQRRRVRLDALDADHQSAAVGDPRRARDQGPRGGGERPGRRQADQLFRAFLRPQDHRRSRGGSLSGGDQGSAGISGAPDPRDMKSFDVVVIGGGPGGYIAAIRAAQLGLSTACIDEAKGADGKPALGGTCTNVGCIPSKALLQSSENYEQVGHHFAEHGIKVKGLDLDLATMLKRKDKVVKASNDGVLYLFKKNRIEFFHGRGSLGKSPGDVVVNGETLQAKNVIIATGSNPRALPGADFDEKLILSNAGALAIPD